MFVEGLNNKENKQKSRSKDSREKNRFFSTPHDVDYTVPNIPHNYDQKFQLSSDKLDTKGLIAFWWGSIFAILIIMLLGVCSILYQKKFCKLSRKDHKKMSRLKFRFQKLSKFRKQSNREFL